EHLFIGATLTELAIPASSRPPDPPSSSASPDTAKRICEIPPNEVASHNSRCVAGCVSPLAKQAPLGSRGPTTPLVGIPDPAPRMRLASFGSTMSCPARSRAQPPTALEGRILHFQAILSSPNQSH